MAHAVGLEGRLEVTRAQALTDDLTQLGNRRLLVEDLDRAVAVASPDTPAALVLFDLNGFKHYNDTFGHLEGDRLLAQLARRLEQRRVRTAGRPTVSAATSSARSSPAIRASSTACCPSSRPRSAKRTTPARSAARTVSR